jgi:hypothetical protein
MTCRTLGTVTYLTAGMDSPWTARDKWTNPTSCPQPDHTCLGQAIKRTSALTTDTWITVRLDTAVTHTDPSDYGEVIYFFWGKRKRKTNRQKRGIYVFGQRTPEHDHGTRTSAPDSSPVAPNLTPRTTPGRRQKSASLRSDAIAVANVIAMSWIG